MSDDKKEVVTGSVEDELACKNQQCEDEFRAKVANCPPNDNQCIADAAEARAECKANCE